MKMDSSAFIFSAICLGSAACARYTAYVNAVERPLLPDS